MAIDFVFCDIGGTLGERNPASGVFTVFPSSARLLKAIRDDMGLRIGVITTLGTLTNSQGLALLTQAGLAGFRRRLRPWVGTRNEVDGRRPDGARVDRFVVAQQNGQDGLSRETLPLATNIRNGARRRAIMKAMYTVRVARA